MSKPKSKAPRKGKQGNRPKFTVAKIEEALRRAGGIRSAAALMLGCAPATIRNYIDRHPELAQAEAEILDVNLDLAESKLLKAVESGNMTAIIFYLKCKGKDRGYTERAQIEGPGGGPVRVRPDLSELTADDLKKLRDMVDKKDGK